MSHQENDICTGRLTQLILAHYSLSVRPMLCMDLPVCVPGLEKPGFLEFFKGFYYHQCDRQGHRVYYPG